jgi:hypothetical protein
MTRKINSLVNDYRSTNQNRNRAEILFTFIMHSELCYIYCSLNFGCICPVLERTRL